MPGIDEILKAAEKTKDLSGKDLTKARLAGADLSGYDLSNAKLARANLSRTILRGAKLDGADLSKANLKEADLSGASGAGTSLRGASMEKVRADGLALAGPDLSGSIIKEGAWSETILDGPKAAGAQIQKVSFTGCKIKGAGLSEVVLSRVSLKNTVISEARIERCRLNDTTFTDCRIEGGSWNKSDLSLCRFERTQFEGVDLGRSDLSGSAFKDSSFRSCKLERTIFLATDWQGSAISGGEVKGANFKYAKGLTPQEERRLREAGAKVGRHLVKRSFTWMLKTNVGRIALIAIVLACLALFQWYKTNPNFWRYERILEVANQELNQGDLGDAERLFKIIIRKCDGIPDYTNPAHLGMANIALRRGDLKGLEEHVGIITSAPAANPGIQEEAQLLEIDYYIGRKQYDKALELIATLEATDGSGMFADSLVNRKVNIHRARGELDLAEKAIVNYLSKIDPQGDAAWNVRMDLANIYNVQGRKDEALALLKEVTAGAGQTNTIFEAYNQMAQIYREQGQYDLEKQIRQEIAERFPDESSQMIENKMQLASLARDEGRKDEARKMLLEIVNDEMISSYQRQFALQALAQWAVEDRNYEEARGYYMRAIEDLPPGQELINAYINLAGLERQLDNNPKAQEYFEQALKIAESSEDRAMVLQAYAGFQSSMGKHSEAERLLKQALELAKSHGNADQIKNIRVSLARVYRSMGKRAEALDILNGMLSSERSDEDRNLRQEIAQIHREGGELKKAMEVLAQAADKYQDDSGEWIRIQLNMADIAIEMGESDRARSIVMMLIDDHFSELSSDLLRAMGILNSAGDKEGYLKLAQQIADDDSQDEFTRMEAVRQLANAERANGNPDKAVSMLKGALGSVRETENSFLIIQDLANLYNEADKSNEAIDLLNDSLKKDFSSFAKINLTTLLGQIYAGQDKYDRAIAVLQGLESECAGWTREECLPAMDQLARIYQRAGEESKAKALYQTMIKNFPGSQFAEEAKKQL